MTSTKPNKKKINRIIGVINLSIVAVLFSDTYLIPAKTFDDSIYNLSIVVNSGRGARHNVYLMSTSSGEVCRIPYSVYRSVAAGEPIALTKTRFLNVPIKVAYGDRSSKSQVNVGQINDGTIFFLLAMCGLLSIGLIWASYYKSPYINRLLFGIAIMATVFTLFNGIFYFS